MYTWIEEKKGKAGWDRQSGLDRRDIDRTCDTGT